ncbi:hypothetical protein BaRGS_00020138, partial [Batillaria attramentaria]
KSVPITHTQATPPPPLNTHTPPPPSPSDVTQAASPDEVERAGVCEQALPLVPGAVPRASRLTSGTRAARWSWSQTSRGAWILRIGAFP